MPNILLVVRAAVTVLAGVCLTGCANDSGGGGPLADVPLHLLRTDPLLEVGVVEGDPVFELHEVVSSVRLTDGRIVIANAGSNQILCVDSTGQVLWTSGRTGSGPGEFRRLSRLYRHGADSLLALDRGLNRVSVFGTEGEFGDLIEARSISGDSVFPMDVWLDHRFWVDGAFRSEDRAATSRTLARLPLPDAAPGYRFVQVDAVGNLWIREPLSGDSVSRWTIVDTLGTPVAAVETPRRFEPHDIGSDFVLGRWLGENDVNFIRLYRLQGAGASVTPPAWMRNDLRARLGTLSAADEARVQTELQMSLRMVVLAQETYFADHGSYADVADSLTWDPADGVSLDIISATGRGWSAVSTHRDLSRVCGMAVGSGTPPGWSEGVVRCG